MIASNRLEIQSGDSDDVIDVLRAQRLLRVGVDRWTNAYDTDSFNAVRVVGLEIS